MGLLIRVDCSALIPELKEISPGVAIHKCLTIYRAFFLLNNLCNIVYGTLIIVCLKLIAGVVVCFVVFGLIRMGDRLDPFSYSFLAILLVLGLVFLSVISTFISIIATTSEKRHKSWSLLIQDLPTYKQAEVKRSIKSLHSIRCTAGGLYHIEASTKLSYLDIVINGIVFALLTFN